MSRKLPSWMSTKGNADSASDPTSGNKLYCAMELPESFQIIYSHQYKDCCIICDELSSALEKPTVIAVDTEWPVNYKSKSGEQKTSVIQLCSTLNKCYVFHVSQMGGIPGPLKSLLEDASIKKVGLNIAGDLWKLHRVFENISIDVLKGHIELSDLANKVLNTNEKWSLDNLCQYLFKQMLVKDTVRVSQWDNFPLTENQLKYAALDAYVSLLIYLELDK